MSGDNGVPPSGALLPVSPFSGALAAVFELETPTEVRKAGDRPERLASTPGGPRTRSSIKRRTPGAPTSRPTPYSKRRRRKAIPLDVKAVVASFLALRSVRTLGALQCASRDWRGASEFAWRQLEVLDWRCNVDSPVDPPALAALVRRCPSLVVLRVGGTRPCDALLEAAADHCPRLRHLRLGPLVRAEEGVLARVLPRLDCLEVSAGSAFLLTARGVCTASEALAAAGAATVRDVWGSCLAPVLATGDVEYPGPSEPAAVSTPPAAADRSIALPLPLPLPPLTGVNTSLGVMAAVSKGVYTSAGLRPRAAVPTAASGTLGLPPRSSGLAWSSAHGRPRVQAGLPVTDHLSAAAAAATATAAAPAAASVSAASTGLSGSGDCGAAGSASLWADEAGGEVRLIPRPTSCSTLSSSAHPYAGSDRRKPPGPWAEAAAVPLIHAPEWDAAALPLRRLKLPHRNVTTDALVQLLRRAPLLTHLDLGSTEFETEEGRCEDCIPAAALCCPLLEHMVVSFAAADDDQLALLARRCPRLRIFYGVDCSAVTDDGATSLADGCPSLQVLSLRDSSITNAGIRYVARQCRGLRKVHLPCDSGTSLRHLTRACPRLAALLLDGVERVLADDVVALARLSAIGGGAGGPSGPSLAARLPRRQRPDTPVTGLFDAGSASAEATAAAGAQAALGGVEREVPLAFDTASTGAPASVAPPEASQSEFVVTASAQATAAARSDRSFMSDTGGVSLRIVAMRGCSHFSEDGVRAIADAFASSRTSIVLGGCSSLSRAAVRRLCAAYAHIHITD